MCLFRAFIVYIKYLKFPSLDEKLRIILLFLIKNFTERNKFKGNILQVTWWLVSQHIMRCSQVGKYSACTWTLRQLSPEKNSDTFFAPWSLGISKVAAECFLWYWITNKMCKLILRSMQLFLISHINIEDNFCRLFS